MKNYLKYDDVKVFKYDNLVLAVIYTIGHILIAMTCNRIITGATLDMAAADAFIEPCLLYTSPSPRDGLLSRMPSSA